MHRYASLMFLFLCGVPFTAFCHGPTLCVGTITYSDPTSVTLDLRFGVGLLHKQVDPDDDAFITNQEWTSATPHLQKFFREGIEIRSGSEQFPPENLKLRLTSGSEIQVIADIKLPDESTTAALALPVLKQLPALPPAVVSVWKDNSMVKPPSLLWFGKQLEFTPTN